MCENMCVHAYVCRGWVGGVWGYVCVCMQAFVCMPALAHGMTVSQGYWGTGKRGKRELKNEEMAKKEMRRNKNKLKNTPSQSGQLHKGESERKRDLKQKTNDW